MNKTGVWLCLFFLALYLILGGGHFYINDDRSEFLGLHSWLTGQGFAVDNIDGVSGREGKTYSKYGWFCFVKSLPFYLAGGLCWKKYLFTSVVGDYPLGPYFWFCLQDAFWGALAVWIFYLLALKLFRERTALTLSFFFGLATMFPVYAKQTYTEVFLTALLLGSVYLLFFKAGRLAPWGAGILLGMALGLRPANLLYLVLLTLVLWGFPSERKKLLPFWGPIFFSGLVYLAYNYYRFGSFFAFGYGSEKFDVPLLTGVYGLLFSPGKGIFLYNLLLLPALLGFFPLKRRAPQLFWATLAILGGLLLFYGRWWSWYGGHSWGPRFLLPALPLLLLPLGYLLESGKLKKVIYVLAAAGFLLQIPGVLVCYQDYFFNTPAPLPYPAQRLPDALMEKINFNPAFSPITGSFWTLSRMGKFPLGDFPQFNPRQAREAAQKQPDLWWVRMKDYQPIKGSLNGLLAMLIALAALSLYRLRSAEGRGRKAGGGREAKPS